MSNADTLLRNQLHIIGETKYKEFKVINNFWKQQHFNTKFGEKSSGIRLKIYTNFH